MRDATRRSEREKLFVSTRGSLEAENNCMFQLNYLIQLLLPDVTSTYSYCTDFALFFLLLG